MCLNPMSREQVEVRVKDLPEVKEYLKQFSSGGGIVETDQKTRHYYIAHVYEIVKEQGEIPSHAATFNWYVADECNGQIVSSMFSYDENGNPEGLNHDYDKYIND